MADAVFLLFAIAMLCMVLGLLGMVADGLTKAIEGGARHDRAIRK